MDDGIQYWQQCGQFQQEHEEMGRYASDTGGDFEEPPVGNHVARCIQLLDLGTQHGEYNGKPTARNQVLFTWELCEELMGDGRPFTVGKFYTNSLAEKSNLRPDLEAWRGRAFTTDELAQFDLEKVLGAPCMLQLVKNDKGKVKVASIASMPKGVKAPEPANKPVSFWIDEWDQQLFDGLPEGLKKMIQSSDEYKKRMRPEPPDDDQAPVVKAGIVGMDDDIPF